MVIIGILTAIFVPSYLKFQTHLSLQRSAIKLAQDVKSAQEMALAAAECPSCPSGEASNTGYGIYFDKAWNDQKYRLYADTVGDNKIFDATDTPLGTIDLEDKIYIYDIDNISQRVSINFTPPDPEVTINNIGSDLTDTTITLCVRDTDCGKAENTMKIKINAAGLIYVE